MQTGEWNPTNHRLADRPLQATYAFVGADGPQGETVTRFAIVNPRTTEADVSGILDTMT